MKCPWKPSEEGQPARPPASAAEETGTSAQADWGKPHRHFRPGRSSWGGPPFFHRERPKWWPESETWPPTPQHAKSLRRAFFRRVGCLFLFASLLLAFFITLGVVLLARLLGWINISGAQSAGPYTRIFLLVGAAMLLGLGFLAWTGRRLRWMSAPVGDLMEASQRVAAGDYTSRVNEQGPQEIRALAGAFNQMAGQLQTSDEQRRRMLADISHELRTPLTIVQGNLEGLLDGVYPADEAHLKSIFEETQVLARLVEDLHVLALAESSALQLRREPTDLAVLIAETVAAFRAQASSAGVSLTVETPEQAARLSLDPLRMHEVLSNLVANALRYTPPGGKVQIQYKLVADGEKRLALVEVSDSGPGITPQDLPYVFERFYKGRDSGGSGLGLAIARRLVEAHGGAIQAISPPGAGTTIRIQIPVSRAASYQIPDPKPES